MSIFESESSPLAASSATSATALWRLSIAGMYCAACAARLQKVLRATPLVNHAEVNFASAQAEVEASQELGLPALLAVVERCGFSVPLLEQSLQISGIS